MENTSIQNYLSSFQGMLGRVKTEAGTLDVSSTLSTPESHLAPGSRLNIPSFYIGMSFKTSLLREKKIIGIAINFQVVS